MDTVANRRLQDRRGASPFFNRYQFGTAGRRVTPRRASGNATAYVDQYDRGVMLVAVGIVCLSALDATFTLRLLSLGAIEINAIMATLIERDLQTFINYKLALTSLAVLLLVIHKDVKLSIGIRVVWITRAILVLYGALIAYELMLFRVILG